MTANGLAVKRSVIFKSQSDPTFDMKPEYSGGIPGSGWDSTKYMVQ